MDMVINRKKKATLNQRDHLYHFSRTVCRLSQKLLICTWTDLFNQTTFQLPEWKLVKHEI